MSDVKITDAALEAELRSAKHDVMLKGADGRYLGLYSPFDSASLQPQISEEELERRLADAKSGKTKTYTTREVIAKLRSKARHAIPAIILTGDISADSLRMIATSGCEHLSKPVGARELTILAQRLLADHTPPVPGAAASAPTDPVPIHEGVAALDATQQLPRRNGSATTQTVYVVDDERDVREGLRDFLADNGYLVETAADGAAFFESYRPGGTACLLVDAQMPGMSGIELIEQLKVEGHTLPAIVITGHGDVALAVRAMKAGALDFIEKRKRESETTAHSA